jgi:hypothetical protein
VLFAGAMELYFWKQDPAGEPGNVGGEGWSVRYKDQEVRDNKLVKELKVCTAAAVYAVKCFYHGMM